MGGPYRLQAALTWRFVSINSNDRLSPNTNYIASISSSIQDQDGNFLDCFDSKGVDDNCEWNFSTSGSSSNPTISLNPSSGTVATSVIVTGNGFEPFSTVAITFEGSTVATVTPTSSGGFSSTFIVPLSSSDGDHTVKATQAGNSASKTFTVTSLLTPVIALNPISGPAGTSVTVTGAGFDASSTITIKFDGNAIATTPSTVTSTPAGFFTAVFNVPSSSSNGDHTVIGTDGTNSPSKTFTVTSTVTPTIMLNSTSGPVGTPVNITGSGFSPSSTVTITFGGSVVTTDPSSVTTNNSGGFSATFAVPESSSGPQIVKATQGSNSPSKTFTVTEGSSLLATSRSNVSSFGARTHQSNVSLVPPSSSQSNASIPVVTNNSFHTAESNGTIPFENNAPSLNASSILGTENTSTSPTVKQMNDTSVISSTDNTINNNPATSASTQSNDTSNSKKSSEKSIPVSPSTSNDQRTSTVACLVISKSPSPFKKF